MPSRDHLYLFLDIDGVLRRLTSPEWKFDRDCLSYFEAIVGRFPQLEIVISSSWRIEFSLQQIKTHFSTDIASRIAGMTPVGVSLKKHYRYREVMHYLHDIGASRGKWIAVDDTPAHFPEYCSLVITDPDTGFDNVATERLRRLITQDEFSRS